MFNTKQGPTTRSCDVSLTKAIKPSDKLGPKEFVVVAGANSENDTFLKFILMMRQLLMLQEN